jgi:hypothetical protein
LSSEKYNFFWWDLNTPGSLMIRGANPDGSEGKKDRAEKKVKKGRLSKEAAPGYARGQLSRD